MNKSCYNCILQKTCFGWQSLMNTIECTPFVYPVEYHYHVISEAVADCCKEFKPRTGQAFYCPTCDMYYYDREPAGHLDAIALKENENITVKICEICFETRHKPEE